MADRKTEGLAVRFGELLKEYQALRGVRSIDLAARADLSNSAIAQYRMGVSCPSLSVAVELAEALDFSLDELKLDACIEDACVELEPCQHPFTEVIFRPDGHPTIRCGECLALIPNLETEWIGEPTSGRLIIRPRGGA